jgi:hypothetical protein
LTSSAISWLDTISEITGRTGYGERSLEGEAMTLFSSRHYANVTATLALGIALGGGGYAAGVTAGHHANRPADKTAPVAVIAVAKSGRLVHSSHEVPATGAPKVKRIAKGTYTVTIPGVKYRDIADAAVCTSESFEPVIMEADGSGTSTFLTTAHKLGDGSAVNVAFKCAIWNLDGK